jgi:hypothetical protein
MSSKRKDSEKDPRPKVILRWYYSSLYPSEIEFVKNVSKWRGKLTKRQSRELDRILEDVVDHPLPGDYYYVFSCEGCRGQTNVVFTSADDVPLECKWCGADCKSFLREEAWTEDHKERNPWFRNSQYAPPVYDYRSKKVVGRPACESRQRTRSN